MLLRMLLRITNLPSESSFRFLPGLTQSSVGQHRGYRRHIGPLMFLSPNIPNEVGRDLFKKRLFSGKKSGKSGI